MNPVDYFTVGALVPFGLLGGLLLFERPGWIPLVLLLTATVTPWSFAKGVTPVMALVALASMMTILAVVLGFQRRFPGALAQRRVTLAFAVGAVVSSLLGWLGAEQEILDAIKAEWLPVQAGQLAAIVLGPAALLLTARFVTTRRQLAHLVWAYTALTAVGLLQSLTVGAIEFNLRGLVLTWSAGLLLGQLLYNRRLGRPIWILLLVVFVLTIYVKVVTGLTWVSGWLPTIVACAVIGSFRWPKTMGLVVAAAILAVVMAGDSLKDSYDREYQESGGTRLNKWTLVLRQPFVWNHLLFGTGAANYAVYFTVYTPADRMSTHNNYLDIFLQLGLVGVALIMALLVSVGRLAFRLSRSDLEDPFLLGFARSMTGGVVAVVVAMALGDWFTPFVFNQGLAGFSWTVQSWIFLGALCALPRVLASRVAEAGAFRVSRASHHALGHAAQAFASGGQMIPR